MYKRQVSQNWLTQVKGGLAPESCLPNWHCFQASRFSSSPDLALLLPPPSPSLTLTLAARVSSLSMSRSSSTSISSSGISSSWGGGGGRDKGLSWERGCERGSLVEAPALLQNEPALSAQQTEAAAPRKKTDQARAKANCPAGWGELPVSASWAPWVPDRTS